MIHSPSEPVGFFFFFLSRTNWLVTRLRKVNKHFNFHVLVISGWPSCPAAGWQNQRDTPTETEINKNTPLILPCLEVAKGSSVLSEDTAAVILSAETLHKAPAWARGGQTKEKDRWGKEKYQWGEHRHRGAAIQWKKNPKSSIQLAPRWCSSRPQNGWSTTAYINTIDEYSRQIDLIQNQLLWIIFLLFPLSILASQCHCWRSRRRDVIVRDMPRHRQSMER